MNTDAPTNQPQPPAELEDLMTRPLVGVLGTLREDGWVQSNPMWFDYSAAGLRMSHTSSRKKLQNLLAHPQVSFCIVDPSNTYRYIELRMTFLGAERDEGASFHREIRKRYGMKDTVVADAEERVVLRFKVNRFGGRHMVQRS